MEMILGMRTQLLGQLRAIGQSHFIYIPISLYSKCLWYTISRPFGFLGVLITLMIKLLQSSGIPHNNSRVIPKYKWKSALAW